MKELHQFNAVWYPAGTESNAQCTSTLETRVSQTLLRSRAAAKVGGLRTRFWVPSPAPRLTFASKSSNDLAAADSSLEFAVYCRAPLPK